VAGEDLHRANWIRRQRCRACGGPGPCELHHAESGTTYDPDEPPPRKSAGPKRGKGQRCHDKWGMSLHTRCHGQFTDHTGFSEGWSDQERAQWEHDQVAEMRKLYDEEFPNGDPAKHARAIHATGKSDKPARKPGSTGSADAERARIVRVIRARAAERQHLSDHHALLAELADDIAGGLNETGAF
jgi:hypothetical protein